MVNLQRVTTWKKAHVIYSFFLVRKIVAHIVTFVFYCVVLPATVLVPEVEVPKWAAVYIPSVITILNAIGTPRYGFLAHCYFFIFLCSIVLTPRYGCHVPYFDPSGHSTYWCSGSFSRMSCHCTGQRPPLSVFWRPGE